MWWTLGPSLGAVFVAGPCLTVVATATAIALGAVPLLGASAVSASDLSVSAAANAAAAAVSGSRFLGTPASYASAVRLAIFPPWKRFDPSVWRHTLAAGLAAGARLLAASCLSMLERTQDLSDASSSSSEPAGQGELLRVGRGDLTAMDETTAEESAVAAANDMQHAAARAAWGALWDAGVEVATYPLYFLIIKSITYSFLVLLTAEVAARRKSDLTPRGVPHVITTAVVGASLLVIVADWGFSQLLLLRTW